MGITSNINRRLGRHIVERGSVLPVVLFIAVMVLGLATISSSRIVQEVRTQRNLEEKTRAYNSAFAQLHMAINVINLSAYDASNHNLALRNALGGAYGGTVSGAETGDDPLYLVGEGGEKLRVEKPGGISSGYVDADAAGKTKALSQTGEGSWLDDPVGVQYGLVEGTNVRVYHARDYIQRLQKLNGEAPEDIDPMQLSDRFFVIEAAGRSGDTVRLVSALVRETEPFSSFVFFQNRGTLGVSGAPRGLIHANEKLAFYFKDGNYADPVSAVDGFEYRAGATEGNTEIRDGNDTAAPIALEATDFDALKAKADFFQGEAGLDAEVKLKGDSVEIKEYTRPRHETVERSVEYQAWIGSHQDTRMVETNVQIGETEVTYTERVQTGTTTETYMASETVQVGTETVTEYRDETVQTGTREVSTTTSQPIYDTRTVTRTRMVTTLVPLSEVDPSAGGGTVGGGGQGEIMVEVTVEEEYEVTETYVSGYEDVTTTTTEPVYETNSVPYEVTRPVYETSDVERTREVPVYADVEKTRMDPIYELQMVEQEYTVHDYETRTWTWTEEVFVSPELVRTTELPLPSGTGATMYVDGRITKLSGELEGRLTIVGNEKVRVTGDIQYVDRNGQKAMLNGNSSNYLDAYARNPDYVGDSTLGVVARDDILLTSSLPDRGELNGTLMSVDGRVGIDAFVTKPDGDVVVSNSSNRDAYLSAEQKELWRAYERTSYDEDTFKKNSLRRIGGVISNNRILETWIRTEDEVTEVQYGFVAGKMKFDISLVFNPPPNFIEVPRPVTSHFVPVMLARDSE